MARINIGQKKNCTAGFYQVGHILGCNIRSCQNIAYSYVGNKRGVEISGRTGNFSKIDKWGVYNKSVKTNNNSKINIWEGI